MRHVGYLPKTVYSIGVTLCLKGASLEIKIEWQCNYDLLLIFHILGSPDDCLPLYSFSRLDVSSEERKAAIGYNFRFANHYYTINKDLYARTLYKAYGIRFIINVVGQAGRFSIVQFFKV
jgi:P2X purinoceptor 3